MKTKYNKKDMEVLAHLWDKSGDNTLVCPQCEHKMIIVQVEPIQDAENAFIPYDTIIECTSCDFKIRAESFTLFGGVKDFNLNHVEIGSWSPSGSRVVSDYEHVLNFELLKELKKSGELVEFLIVNKHIVEVIG